MGGKAGWIAGLVVGGLLLASGFVYLGVYDVAATNPHSEPVHWLLRTMTARSIAVRADDVQEGDIPDLSDSALVRLGSRHFADTCARCHGAPGVERDEAGQGLYPEGPSLHETAEHWSDRELFWIAKNGMKFTGMPAFGLTHSDEDIWSMVAFMRLVSELSPEDYAAMTDGTSESAGHSHEGLGR